MPTSNVTPLLISQNMQFHLMAEKFDNEPRAVYNRVFKTEKTELAFEDYMTWIGYGSPQLTMRREPIAMGETAPNFSRRYIMQKYTLADSFAKEDVEDDQVGLLNRLVPAKGGMMARVFDALKERLAAEYIFSTGFSTASPVPGSPDGVSLFNTAHPISLTNTGTTWSNTLGTPADLSNSTYYSARSNLYQQPAPNNYNLLSAPPRKLVINPSQEAVGRQLVKGTTERNSSYFINENLAADDNLELVVWAYDQYGNSQTSGNYNAWAVLSEYHCLLWLERKGYTVETWYDGNTQTFIASAYMRMDYGHYDPHGVFGSPGGSA